jgi:hypothetical protein
VFCNGHFIEQSMDAVVTGPANIDALGQEMFIEGSLEVPPPVQLFRNEVMESECAHLPAGRASALPRATPPRCDLIEWLSTYHFNVFRQLNSPTRIPYWPRC